MSKNSKKTIKETAVVKEVAAVKETVPATWPYPYSPALRTRTFVILGKDDKGKLSVVGYRRHVSVNEADKRFPIDTTKDGHPYIFGPMVRVVRTIAQVAEIAGCDENEARAILRVNFWRDKESGSMVYEVCDPRFYTIGLEDCYAESRAIQSEKQAA